MIIHDLFIILDEHQEKLLFEKYKDIVMIKTVLKTHLDNAVIYECTKIKNEKEKADRALNQESRI